MRVSIDQAREDECAARVESSRSLKFLGELESARQQRECYRRRWPGPGAVMDKLAARVHGEYGAACDKKIDCFGGRRHHVMPSN